MKETEEKKKDEARSLDVRVKSMDAGAACEQCSRDAWMTRVKWVSSCFTGQQVSFPHKYVRAKASCVRGKGEREKSKEEEEEEEEEKKRGSDVYTRLKRMHRVMRK